MSPAAAPAATPHPTGVPWLNAGPSRLKLKDRTGAIKRYPRGASPMGRNCYDDSTPNGAVPRRPKNESSS